MKKQEIEMLKQDIEDLVSFIVKSKKHLKREWIYENHAIAFMSKCFGSHVRSRKEVFPVFEQFITKKQIDHFVKYFVSKMKRLELETMAIDIEGLTANLLKQLGYQIINYGDVEEGEILRYSTPRRFYIINEG